MSDFQARMWAALLWDNAIGFVDSERG
jgi:hypothetical protein